MQDKPPNILILQCDQLAASALPCYGNEVVQSPHMDDLAEDGVVFTNAYCNSPLCAPSRFSMMSGQLPSKIGAYDNGAEFPADVPTFAHYLRNAGYRTVLCGKMHFVGADQMHGFEERLTTDIYPADHGWTPDWEQPENRADWWYHNMDSVTGAGPNERANQIDFDDEVGFRAKRHVYDMARSKDDRPFCMVVSFTDPHDPYVCPKEHWDRYGHDAIDMPRTPHVPYDQLDPHGKRLRHAYCMGEGEMDPADIRNARHAYYGQISYLDDKVGSIMKALEDTGMREDTVVMLVADHGDMLGEHGLWYKMTLREGAARIPCILSAPERFAPRRVDDVVSLVDLLPTLLDLAGVPEEQVAAPVDGRSLLSLAQGAGAQPERTVASEYLAEGAVAPMLMLRRGRYKYIHCPADPPQLFDLVDDPEELHNLAAEAQWKDVVAGFEQEALAHADFEALHAEVIASQRRRRVVFSAHMTGNRTPWDYAPPSDAHQRYMRNHLDLNDVEAGRVFVLPDEPGRSRIPTPAFVRT